MTDFIHIAQAFHSHIIIPAECDKVSPSCWQCTRQEMMMLFKLEVGWVGIEDLLWSSSVVKCHIGRNRMNAMRDKSDRGRRVALWGSKPSMPPNKCKKPLHSHTLCPQRTTRLPLPTEKGHLCLFNGVVPPPSIAIQFTVNVCVCFHSFNFQFRKLGGRLTPF